MARKDSRGRNLRQGESQRKDGRYEYRFTDNLGRRRSVYSWRLVASDPTPKDKKDCIPLRDMEKDIRNKVENYNVPLAFSTKRLNEYFDEFMNTRKDLELTTWALYTSIYNNHLRGSLGNKKLSSLNKRQMLTFMKALYDSKGWNVTRTAISALSGPMKQAVFEGYLKDSPLAGVMRYVRPVDDFDPSRVLSVEEEQTLVGFILDHYNNVPYAERLDGLDILLFMDGSGLRIGEAAALTWDNVDFERGLIRVDRALKYTKIKGRPAFTRIGSTKTVTGTRVVPITEKSMQALKMASENRGIKAWDRYYQGDEKLIDSIVFKRKDGRLYIPIIIQNTIKLLREQCNIFAEENVLEPVQHFSSHWLRHTFCSRMCEAGMNIKVLQSIMGHKDFMTTMNIYTSLSDDFIVESVERLASKITQGFTPNFTPNEEKDMRTYNNLCSSEIFEKPDMTAFVPVL